MSYIIHVSHKRPKNKWVVEVLHEGHKLKGWKAAYTSEHDALNEAAQIECELLDWKQNDDDVKIVYKPELRIRK